MLLRPTHIYQVSTTAQIQTLLDRLQGINLKVDKNAASDVIHQVLVALWTRAWPRTEHCAMPCPTIRALVLLSLRPGGAFQEPSHVMEDIVKFEYAIRLTCLYEIKKRSHLQYDGDDILACNSMDMWFIEMVESPFNSLCSYMHRAAAIVFNTNKMPKVWWTDSKNWSSMQYKGHPVHHDQLKQVYASVEQALVDTWEKKVLRGLRVHLEYSTIYDDLANQDIGYCFLEDHRNIGFKDCNLLRNAILQDPIQRAHFTLHNTTTGNETWNKLALRGWLQDYTSFETLRMTKSEMNSGSSGRGEELAAMDLRNTKTRSGRNLYTLEHFVAMVKMYTKPGALTGLDKLIPSALDAVNADLTIQSLVVARSFALSIVKLLFPEDANLHMLYQNTLFVGMLKRLTTEDLSGCMGEFTLPVIGIKVGVRPYRHINSAFLQKRCRTIAAFFDNGGKDDKDVVGALQMGHSERTDIQVYGLSPEAMLGPSENVLPMYLACSTHQQTDFGVVPGKNIFCVCSINSNITDKVELN
jgi:hypothetical protein